MNEQTSYEMFWDCPFCHSKELLGLTHRHCPTCGSRQDPSTRYFPPEDRKVEVANHRFVGADKLCAACGATAAASAACCGGCGAPLDGEAEVARVDDVVVGGAEAGTPPPAQAAPSPASPPMKSGGILKLIIVALIIGAVGFGIYALLAKKEVTATVVGHRWTRSIVVQRFEEASAEDWCDSLPANARRTGSSSRERSTRQVADGEDCTTRNVDQGDGTFRQEQDCQPRYRSEPVMDQWCTYRAEQWVDQSPTTVQGSGLDVEPSWPKVNVDGCARLGCTREGRRSETYTLDVEIPGEGRSSCELPESRWRASHVGSAIHAELNTATNHLSCN